MEKVSLPIKTKIAAWWMMVIGVFGVVSGFMPWYGRPSFLVQFAEIFSALFFIVPGYFLIKRRRLGWWLAIISLPIILIFLLLVIFYSSPAFYVPEELLFFLPIYSLIFLVYLPLITRYFEQWPLLWWFLIFIPFIPFILLLLDRKNFWKVAV